MCKPTSCIKEGEHQARFRVWMKNGNPEFDARDTKTK